jgi:TetR/AcrR family transcriptional regulator, transcriptional repressor for nem operon
VNQPTDDHPTRQRLLETARRLFHEQGYHATGISTILREADVNSGSLYHYFPSKEALLHGVLELYLRLLRPAVMDPVEKMSDDPIGRVFALLSYYRQGLQMTGFKMGCPIGNLALEVGDDNEAARAVIDQNFHNWSEVVHGWLVDAGERLPATTNRRELAGFILTVMEGAMMRARAARSFAPYDESVNQLRAYVDQLETAARTGARIGTVADIGRGGSHAPGGPHAAS